MPPYKPKDSAMMSTSHASSPVADDAITKIQSISRGDVPPLESSETSSSLSGDADAVSILKPTTTQTKTTTPCSPNKSTSPRRRPSILKVSENEEIPISNKASCWLNLPKPDLSKVPRRCISAPASTTMARAATEAAVQSQPTRRRASSVAFSNVSIREYHQTLGDNPAVSYGPPITLDWEYEEMESVTLEDYEYNRDPRRSLRQLCMNYYTRRNLLMWSGGFTEQELDKATKEMDKVKRGRAVTKYFLPVSKVEDLVASAGRKARRAVSPGPKNGKQKKRNGKKRDLQQEGQSGGSTSK